MQIKVNLCIISDIKPAHKPFFKVKQRKKRGHRGSKAQNPSLSSAFTFILLPYTRSFELPALSSTEHPFLQLFSISLPPGPLSPPFVPRCICCLSILHSTPTPFPLPPRRWWPYTDRITDSCCQSLSRRTDGSSNSSRRSGDGNPPTRTHLPHPFQKKQNKNGGRRGTKPCGTPVLLDSLFWGFHEHY